MSPHIAVMCAAACCLLLVSALVSGAETAFFSLSPSDVRRIRGQKSASAEAVLFLLKDVDMLLATILVVNNLVNICIVILASGIIDSIFTFRRFEFLFKTVLVTFLLLLFGEIRGLSLRCWAGRRGYGWYAGKGFRPVRVRHESQRKQ